MAAMAEHPTPAALQLNEKLGDDGDRSSKASAEVPSPNNVDEEVSLIPWRYKGPALAMILLFNRKLFFISFSLSPV